MEHFRYKCSQGKCDFLNDYCLLIVFLFYYHVDRLNLKALIYHVKKFFLLPVAGRTQFSGSRNRPLAFSHVPWSIILRCGVQTTDIGPEKIREHAT